MNFFIKNEIKFIQIESFICVFIVEINEHTYLLMKLLVKYFSIIKPGIPGIFKISWDTTRAIPGIPGIKPKFIER